MMGVNNCWSAITLTTPKKTTNNAVNGRASLNASPRRCSFVIPLNEVERIMTPKPMIPTAARWRAKAIIKKIPTSISM